MGINARSNPSALEHLASIQTKVHLWVFFNHNLWEFSFLKYNINIFNEKNFMIVIHGLLAIKPSPAGKITFATGKYI